MIRAGLFLVILAVVTANIVQYKDCGSVSGKIESVDVSPCPAEPCQLKKNTNVTMTVKFNPSVNSEHFKTVVHGIIGGIPVPFPTANGNVTPSVPIKPSTEVTYTNAVYVNPSYPKIQLLIKWELAEDSGKDLFCLVIPAEIVE